MKNLIKGILMLAMSLLMLLLAIITSPFTRRMRGNS